MFTGALPSGNGIPGNDFDALIAYGQKIKYTDSTGDGVSLTLSGPGTLDVVRPLTGNAMALEFTGIVNGLTGLTGWITPGPASPGTVTVGSLTGLGGVYYNLPSSQFLAPPFV
jgi:hypothetical protein